MARPFNAGDAGNARRTRLGRLPKKVKLPGGAEFTNSDKSGLVQYLRKNPGYVWKNRGYLKSQVGDALALAGYNVTDDGRMQQFEYQAGKGKLVRAWEQKGAPAKALKTRTAVEGTKVIPVGVAPKATKPAKAAKPLKPAKAAPGPIGKVTPTSKAAQAAQAGVSGAAVGAAGGTKARKPAASQGAAQDPLMALALKRLLGLNPKAGFTPLDAEKLLQGITTGGETIRKSIQSRLDQIDRDAVSNTGEIDRWFGAIQGDVTGARDRGAALTSKLGQNLAGNNAAVLASIGGEAAQGAKPAADVAMAGQNTLAALGQADQAYLSQLGPSLAAEGATLKAGELRRLADLKRQYSEQMDSVSTESDSKRAELAMQIAQYNNEGRQQGFQNASSLAETLAGLGLSGMEMSQQQQKLILDQVLGQAKLRQDAGDEAWDRQMDTAKLGVSAANSQRDDERAQVRTTDQKIAKAAALVIKGIDPSRYPLYKQGRYAPPQMMKDVLNAYRVQGADVSDPRVRKSIIAAIRGLGADVDPKWIRGWQ